MTAPSAVATEETPAAIRYPSTAVAWFGMVAFFLAQIVATMDRGILSFVVDPVRRDLGASDVQISLLQGLAFAIFYAAVGLPLGMVADLVSRRRLLIAGIAVWSVATFLTGFAHGFGQMFACRLFVGLGEATLGPCAISMIGDLFPPERRARPMSFYLFGGTVSGGLAIILTGAFMGLSPEARGAIPLVGGMAPWRLTFMLCGALGLINVAMLIALPEIRRSGVMLKRGDGLGIAPVARYFAARWRLFLPLFLGVGLWATATSSVVAWGVTHLIRHFGVTLPYVGHRLGTLNMVMAVLGSLLAGGVLGAVTRRAGIRGKLGLAPLLPLMTMPCALIVIAPNVTLALVLASTFSFALPLYGSTMLSALSDLVPANMRGIAVALYAFAGTMIGQTLGPLAVALCTEHVFADSDTVGLAILLVAVPALVAASLLFALARRSFVRLASSDPLFAGMIAGGARA